MEWDRSNTFSDLEVKQLAEHGQIWRERFLWNGKLEKVAGCGMYKCYCIRCGMQVISFNRWTPKYNVCIPCHIKAR